MGITKAEAEKYIDCAMANIRAGVRLGDECSKGNLFHSADDGAYLLQYSVSRLENAINAEDKSAIQRESINVASKALLICLFVTFGMHDECDANKIQPKQGEPKP